MRVIAAQYYDMPVFSEEPLTGEVKPYPVMDEAMKAAIKEYEIPNGYAMFRAAVDEEIRRAYRAKAEEIVKAILPGIVTESDLFKELVAMQSDPDHGGYQLAGMDLAEPNTDQTVTWSEVPETDAAAMTIFSGTVECHCAYCEYSRQQAAKAPPPYIQAMNGRDDPEDALQRILDKVKWTMG